MHRGFLLNNLSLLIHFPWFGVSLDHVDTLNHGFILAAQDPKYFPDPTLVLADNNFNLIVFSQVCFTLSHRLTH